MDWTDDLLAAMLDATRAGVLRWRRTAEHPEIYEAEGLPGARQPFLIHLLYPAFNEESSDRAAARIQTPNLAGLTVFAGTAAMAAVWQILEVGLPDQWGGPSAAWRRGAAEDTTALREAVAKVKPPEPDRLE